MTCRSSFRRHFPIAILLMLGAAIIIVTRWHTFDQPLEWDLSTYTLIARQLLDGKQLYADVWDIKPPGIFAAHVVFQSVLGDSLKMIFSASSVVAIGTMLAIFAAIARTNKWAAILAAMAFAIVSADMEMEANRANTEAYINLFLAGGFAVMVWSRTARGVFVACFLFALATLFKQVAILPAIAFCLSPSPCNRGEGRGDGRDSMNPETLPKHNGQPLTPTLSPGTGRGRKCAILLLTMASVWCALFIYFALTHRTEIAWQTFVLAPRAYGGTLLQQFDSLLDTFKSKPLISFLPLIVMSALAILIDKNHRWQLLLLLASCAFAIALPGHLWAHYLQLLILPMCIGVGWAVAAIASRASRSVAIFVSSTVLIGLAILQSPAYQLPSSQWAERQYGGSYVILQDSIEPLKKLLKPDETFFIWADEPWMYHRSGRSLPTAMVFRSHVVDSPVKDYLAARVLDDLRKSPPDLLLVREGLQGPENHPIWRYLMEHYRPMPYDGRNYPLLMRHVRVGSDLEKRTDVSRS